MTPALLAFARARRREVAVLLAMATSYFFAYFHRVAVPGTVFDEIQRDLGIAAGQVALLGAIYLYIYGGMQVLVGVMADRFGGARVFLAGTLLMNLGALAFPLASSFPLLCAARVVVGLGCSLVFVSVVKVIDEMFGSHDFAPLLGIVMFLGLLGGLSGTLPFERLVRFAGWRAGLLLAGAASAAAFAVAALTLRRARLVHPGRAFDAAHLALVLRNTDSFPVIVSGSINFAVYFLVQAAVGKKLLSDCFGLSSSGAAALTFAMMLVCMACTLASGFVIRALRGRRRLLVRGTTALLLAATLALVAGLSGRGALPLVAAAYLLLACTAAGSAVFTSSMRDLSPYEATGTSIGLLNGVCYVVVAGLVNAAGAVMDRFSGEALRTASAVVYPLACYRAIFAIAAGMALVSLASSFLVPERERE